MKKMNAMSYKMKNEKKMSGKKTTYSAIHSQQNSACHFHN